MKNLTRILLLLALLSPAPVSAQFITKDIGTHIQLGLNRVKLVQQLKELRDQVAVAKSIRDAAKDHKRLYEDQLRGIGIILNGDYAGALDRLTEHVRIPILDGSAAGHGINYQNVENQWVDTWAMYDTSQVAKYDPRQEDEQMMATVTELVITLKECRGQLAATADELGMLEREANAAATPEARRDIQINIELLQTKHSVLQSQCSLEQANLTAVMEARRINAQARGMVMAERAAAELTPPEGMDYQQYYQQLEAMQQARYNGRTGEWKIQFEDAPNIPERKRLQPRKYFDKKN